VTSAVTPYTHFADMQDPQPSTASQPYAGRTCVTCRFWQPDPDTPANELGECRINPPQHHPLPGDPHEPDTQADLPRQPWPVTADDHWCRCWKRGRKFLGMVFVRRP